MSDIDLIDHTKLVALNLANNQLSSIDLIRNQSLQFVNLNNQTIVADVRNDGLLNNRQYILTLSSVVGIFSGDSVEYTVNGYPVVDGVVSLVPNPSMYRLS